MVKRPGVGRIVTVGRRNEKRTVDKAVSTKSSVQKRLDKAPTWVATEKSATREARECRGSTARKKASLLDG